MAEISADRLQSVAEFAGGCNAMTAEHYVSAEGAPFADEDYLRFQDHYLNGSGERIFHKSDVTGWGCIKSLGEVENRKMADRIAKDCNEKLFTGEEGGKKCDALVAGFEKYAEAPAVLSKAGVKHYGKEALKWGPVTIASGYLIGIGFAHMGHIISKWKGPKGPQGPAGGAGAGGGSGASGAKESSAAAPSQRSMTDYALAGAALVGLTIAIAVLVADDATGVGTADDVLLVPASAGWARAAAVFAL